MRRLLPFVFFGLILVVPLTTAQDKSDKSPGENSTPENEWPTVVRGKSLQEWIKELESSDPSRRTKAVLAIGEFGDNAKDAALPLVGRLNDSDVSPRSRALQTLRTISIHEKQVPQIVAGIGKRLHPMNEGNSAVRYDAIMTLQRFAQDAGPAIPDLIVGIQDRGSWEIRFACTQTLWRVSGLQGTKDGPDPKVVSALLKQLSLEPTYEVRLEILMGLGALGRPADSNLRTQVIAALNNAARAENRSYAIWAYTGLAAMQDGEPQASALSAVAKFLTSKTLETRVQAALALGALNTKAKSKVPNLLKMLSSDPETAAINAACSALGSIGDKSEGVVDALMKQLEQKEPSRVAAAVSALVNIKVESSKLIPALDKLRENKDLNINLRSHIEQAIAQLKKPDKKK